MSEPSLPPVRMWLDAPMDHDVSVAIERLRRAPDVQQIAVMPDVHLAADVCIGVVVATSRRIYPQAVGGDIGCGMLAVGFDVEATALQDPRRAGRVLAGLGRAVPARRRNRRAAITPPSDMITATLSDPSLEAMRRHEGLIEFATLGSGNHFIELQRRRRRSPVADGPQWIPRNRSSNPRSPPGSVRGRWRRAAGSGCHEPSGSQVSERRCLGTALRRRKPTGNGGGSGHCHGGDPWCAPLLGDGHHDRSQPRVARTPRWARPLGPSEGRDAGRTWADRSAARVDGHLQLPRGGTRG